MVSKKTRILILGGNGMIGHKLYQILENNFSDTWILIRKKLASLEYKNFFNSNKIIEDFDLSNFNLLNEILNNLNPDIIINASGITIRRGISQNIYNTILLNSALPHFLNNYISIKKDKRLIHFSTDCVFSGKDGSYVENSTLDAMDLYGKSKGLGEIIGENTLTIRSSMIGRELDNHTELLEWFLSKKSSTVSGFSNVTYSGITTIQMAHYILNIILFYPNLKGIYNISAKPITKYDLLILLNDVFETNINILNDENYISNKNLISDKFFNETRLKQPSWNNLVLDLKNDSILNKKYYKN